VLCQLHFLTPISRSQQIENNTERSPFVTVARLSVVKEVGIKFDTLVKMSCWEVVDIPLDASLRMLGVCCVYKIKFNQSVDERHRARLKLVIKAYHDAGERDSL
jgi:hypothetical protein